MSFINGVNEGKICGELEFFEAKCGGCLWILLIVSLLPQDELSPVPRGPRCPSVVHIFPVMEPNPLNWFYPLEC